MSSELPATVAERSHPDTYICRQESWLNRRALLDKPAATASGETDIPLGNWYTPHEESLARRPARHASTYRVREIDGICDIGETTK
jgi:hypothetical protein